MLEEKLKALSYRRLYDIVKGHKEGYIEAAEEIRQRRRNKELPRVSTHNEYKLRDNQKRIEKRLLLALTGDPSVWEKDGIEIFYVAYRARGGWVVYLTGDDMSVIDEKIARTKEMVVKDAKEFGSCRVCLAAIKNNGWDGILVRFDRGLRLVFN